MMRRSVVLCLAVSFAMLGFGSSLQCYSCPDGSSTECEAQQQCSQREDSCLRLTSGDIAYTECLNYNECNFQSLAVRYQVPSFKFSCCTSNLCNRKKSSWWDIFGRK